MPLKLIAAAKDSWACLVQNYSTSKGVLWMKTVHSQIMLEERELWKEQTEALVNNTLYHRLLVESYAIWTWKKNLLLPWGPPGPPINICLRQIQKILYIYLIFFHAETAQHQVGLFWQQRVWGVKGHNPHNKLELHWWFLITATGLGQNCWGIFGQTYWQINKSWMIIVAREYFTEGIIALKDFQIIPVDATSWMFRCTFMAKTLFLYF